MHVPLACLVKTTSDNIAFNVGTEVLLLLSILWMGEPFTNYVELESFDSNCVNVRIIFIHSTVGGSIRIEISYTRGEIIVT